MKEKTEADAKPFLKWAGGKKALIPELLKLVPKKFNKYFEPFLGGGALFFALRPDIAFLSDVNPELINAYQQIKRNVESVIRLLEGMKYDKNCYYKSRSQNSLDKVKAATRFIYLNRTCWNGLFRVNTKGQFNVPMGKYENPTICDASNLRAVSRRLEHVYIKTCDFEEALARASVDDLVYLDPPYVTAQKNNGFIKYNSKLFSLEDQNRLKDCAVELDNRGCKIIMSNANHPYIRNLFKNFNFHMVKRKSLVAGDKKNRGIVKELLITNF